MTGQLVKIGTAAIVLAATVSLRTTPVLGFVVPTASNARLETFGFIKRNNKLPRRNRWAIAVKRVAAFNSSFDSSQENGSAIGGREEEAVPKTAPAIETPSDPEKVEICIVGGGVSGLTAAITAAEALPATKNTDGTTVVLLEASPTLGGRVQSDKTQDGYTLDRGFAVFIEEYPMAKALLDYDALQLGKFLPGALVKTKQSTLARVTDPLRQPLSLFVALLAPVGTFMDKLRLIPLLRTVFTKSVDQLFQEDETDTMTCLVQRYGFSKEFIDSFMKPFLEGIYLAPLEEQSSRMFHFVFKMFSQGAATLPTGGMQAVADQLTTRAAKAGVVIRTNQSVSKIQVNNDGSITVIMTSNEIRATSVVLATDGQVAHKILAEVEGLESLQSLPEQPQRSVGCMYYGFDTKVPVLDPILILNGIGEQRGTALFPVNNVCFPSVIAGGYAPKGCGLCSVTFLKVDEYRGKLDELDVAVRNQLGTWFPDQRENIQTKWVLKGVYDIENAQPAQYKGPFPANVNGGRDSTTYQGQNLPNGLFLCGDHMATATLNGALESGVNAGKSASSMIM